MKEHRRGQTIKYLEEPLTFNEECKPTMGELPKCIFPSFCNNLKENINDIKVSSRIQKNVSSSNKTFYK